MLFKLFWLTAVALQILLAQAQASVFVTSNAGDADLWIYFVEDRSLAECEIYSGAFVEDPGAAIVQVYLAPAAPSADKLVYITTDPNESDDISCLAL